MFRKLLFATLVCLLVIAPAAMVGAQAEEGWCSDVDLVFFPGGPAGGPFASVVYNGALRAEADLGVNVEYIWSNWDPEMMITQFAEAAATSPDGIAVMGHPGVEAFQPLVDEARANGIAVTAQNVPLSELEAAYKGAGFG